MSGFVRFFRPSIGRPSTTPVTPIPTLPASRPSLQKGRVIRVTNASDGTPVPREYSYWPDAWVAPDGLIWVMVGIQEDGLVHFFRVWTNGDVERHGPLLPQYPSTGEDWYWDAQGRIYLLDGPRLRRVDPRNTSDNQIVVDITLTHPNCVLWQAHTSDDGHCHCATVRQIVGSGSYPMIGIVFQRDGVQTFYSVADIGGEIDESAIDTTGQDLIIKISPDDDSLVIDTLTGVRVRLWKSEGALGHSDCGPRFMVGADRDHEARACVKWDLTKPLTMSYRILLAQSPDWGGGDLGHVAYRNGKLIISDGTYIKQVGMNGEGVTNLLEHGMVGNDYDHQVKGNLSPGAEVVCFMTNKDRLAETGVDIQDVHILILGT